MKNTVFGILAHVDAGKTTLSEALLYTSGAIGSVGRVDKGNSFLDNNTEERRRGITIFSKQAHISLDDTEITLVDTPGHVDFSCETERTLSVEDGAILVISAPDGVTPHTVTLWKLLRERNIPTFIFVNKTDLSDRRPFDILSELRTVLSPSVCNFGIMDSDRAKFDEECAGAHEWLMREYFENGSLSNKSISKCVSASGIFPCYFGSALKLNGIDKLLFGLREFIISPTYSKNLFGAKVYKIARDENGARLTYMKITGGTLCPKDTIRGKSYTGEPFTEKVESIRLYSGEKFKVLKEATAGQIVAIPGLLNTYAGMGLGTESNDKTTLYPPLDFKMEFPKGTDLLAAFLKISVLNDEEPTFSIRYDPSLSEIRVRLMGQIQKEVLSKIIEERFGYSVTFSEGSILYKETIAEKAYGAGHFEPLMHYAEVRLRLEPLPQGSGLIFTTNCPQDTLKGNWQRLILSSLEGHPHKGVLGGYPITDMKITLIAGRAHPKHTEGGDFREASLRAVKQGLMCAESILLEPTFDFEIKVPENCLGRAINDINTMHGESMPPEFENGMAILRGNAPVATIQGYPDTLRSFTRGEGQISLFPADYAPCHNSEEILAQRNYDPELDDEVLGSVFCKGGAGYAVPWYEVEEKMHTENPELVRQSSDNDTIPQRARSYKYRGTVEEDKELMRIFESTYGKIKPRRAAEKVENKSPATTEKKRKDAPKKQEEYILIDGYNLIFASDELKRLAEGELGFARDVLIRLVANYHGYKKSNIMIVFDGYKRRDNEGTTERIGGITVIYTKERETADAYIEKASYGMAKNYTVKVVTSDYNEQLIVLGNGAVRVTAKEFLSELESTATEITSLISDFK